MYYKIVSDENGIYANINGESVSLLCCNEAHTPSGLNEGWSWFETEEEALKEFKVS
ncbi:hypothetical protein Dip510_001863 [Elusimicrobium posterum]|uniref:hypothetical protein n=1 Tax=Elusimicrobium posterum TaxID=3116653 RepID=UPI003C72B60F